MSHDRLFLLFPLIAIGVFAVGLVNSTFAGFFLLAVATLLLAVVSAVHHAEVIAHRIGEPYGTLVLALAITVIEVALVLSIMLAGGESAATLARDTVYAAVMIICNGVVGICLLLGGLRHREQSFRIEGTNSGLAALAVLTVLVLVLPHYTTSAPGDAYSTGQLIFVAFCSLALWLVFVFIQTIRHRDYFLPTVHPEDESHHAEPPTKAEAWASVGLLMVSLVAVVGLAKLISPTIERAVAAVGAPKAVVGILVAIIVLMPETWAAIRAARADRLQTSMNLAIGSGLASIGLTVPVVVTASILLGLPLTLGLAPKDIVLVALTFVVAAITLGSGRTNLMQGAVHLIVFLAFLVLTLMP